MNILMLNANTSGTGTYHRALWFARMCALHGGHTATVCTVSKSSLFKRKTRKDIQGVIVTEGPAFAYKFMPGYGSNVLDILWRYNEIRTGKYDLIYAFEYHPNVSWPLYNAKRKNQRILSDWCDWYGGAANSFRGNALLHRWDTRREERIRHFADKVSVISSTLYERAQKIGIHPSRISLLREGVDTTHMKPYPSAPVRCELGIPEDIPVVGTLHDGAAFPALVAACTALRTDFPSIKLMLIGQPRNFHYSILAQHNAEDIFCSTGRCSNEELPRYISAADVCALPLANTCAHQARFPHKIGDYLACGRPLVVTDVGDYPALLKDADAAVVCPPNESFTDALADILKDESARSYYGSKGREWVVKNLDWKVLAPGILDFIESTVSHNH